jgi:hypothetical protein
VVRDGGDGNSSGEGIPAHAAVRQSKKAASITTATTKNVVLTDGTYASVTKTETVGCTSTRPLVNSAQSTRKGVPSRLHLRPPTSSGFRKSTGQQHSSPMISRQRALFSLARYASIVHCRSASIAGDRTLFWRQESGWGSTGTANVFYSHISKAHLPNCIEHVIDQLGGIPFTSATRCFAGSREPQLGALANFRTKMVVLWK